MTRKILKLYKVKFNMKLTLEKLKFIIITNLCSNLKIEKSLN
jgi:hypothetical protein